MSNWPTKKLGDCLIQFDRGISWSRKDEGGAIAVLRIPNIQEGQINLNDLKYISAKNGNGELDKNDIVMVASNGNPDLVGRSALVTEKEKGMRFASFLVRLRLDDTKLLSHYAHLFLLTPTFKRELRRKIATTSGIYNLRKDHIEKIKIPLPPLAIQKQIVERLDKIAEAQKLNDGLIQKTDELFQSLLHKELNPAGPADTKAMAGKKDWEVKKLGDKNVVEIIDGDRGKNYPPKNEFQKSGYCLFLNTKNVTQTGFIFNETDFISKERDEKLRKGKLQRNDVVLTTRGTVGNSALYDDSVEFNHIRINSGMVVLRSNTKEILPKFLWIVLGSKPVLRQFKQILSGTAQPQLPITNLVKIKIPLPPPQIQKQVVAKLSAVQDYKKQLLEQKSKLKELFDSSLARSMNSGQAK